VTKAQNLLYWREVGAWSRTRKAAGKPHDNAARHALHAKALGRDKSHTDFTNREFDAVLATLRAESRPDDFAAQMAVQDSPDVRRHDLQNKCWEAVSVFISGNDLGHSNDLRQRYLDGLSEKVCSAYFDQLDERGLQKIKGILERRVRQVGNAKHAKANTTAEASDKGAPF